MFFNISQSRPQIPLVEAGSSSVSFKSLHVILPAVLKCVQMFSHILSKSQYGQLL